MRHAPARHDAGWRRDPGSLRRFWPAGLTPTAIAVCTLAGIALAGFIVIATSLVVVAKGHGGAPVSASLAQALEACSGELALLALTVAVVLGVAATERHFLPPGTRVTAQIAHRAVALTAVGFLLVHILLETVSARAALLAAVLPFTDARSRLYLGLGTIASDLVIAIMATSLARMRYARSRHPQLWRAVHRSIYVAWPLAILHGMLMRGGPGWAAWTYGSCAALVAVALTARIRLQDPRPPTESSMREVTPARPAPADRPPLAPGPGVAPPPRITPPWTGPRLPRYPSSHPYPDPSLPASWSSPASSPASLPAPASSSPPWAPARWPTDANEP